LDALSAAGTNAQDYHEDCDRQTASADAKRSQVITLPNASAHQSSVDMKLIVPIGTSRNRERFEGRRLGTLPMWIAFIFRRHQLF